MSNENTNEVENADLDALRSALIKRTREAVLQFGVDPAELGYTPAQLGLTEDEIKNRPKPATDVPHQQLIENANPQQTRNKPTSEASMPPIVDPQTSSSQTSPNSPTRNPYGPAVGPIGYLSSLPSERQEYVAAVIKEYPLRRAAEILSGPEPDGLGREITTDTLWRYSRRDVRTKHNERMDRFVQQALVHLDQPDATDEQFTKAATRMVRARLLEASTEADTLDLLETVHKMLNQLRRADQNDRRLAQRNVPRDHQKTDMRPAASSKGFP